MKYHTELQRINNNKNVTHLYEDIPRSFDCNSTENKCYIIRSYIAYILHHTTYKYVYVHKNMFEHEVKSTFHLHFAPTGNNTNLCVVC